MVVKPGMTTLHTDIVIDSEGRKFIMLNMGNAFGDLKPEEVNTEVISQAKVFLRPASGSSGDARVKVCERA